MKTVREKLKKIVSFVLCGATALSLVGTSGVDALSGAVTAWAATRRAHSVTINQAEGGTLTLQNGENGFVEGETVDIEVEFDTDSPLYTVSVETAGGEGVYFEKPDDYTLEFTMPDDDVTVTVEGYYGTTEEFAQLQESMAERDARLAATPATVSTSSTVSVYLTLAGDYQYDNYHTHFFKTTHDGQTIYAYCAEPSLHFPDEDTYTADYNYEKYVASGASDRFLECVVASLYVSYGAPGWDASYWPDKWYDGNDMNGIRYYILEHILISALYGDDLDGALYGTSSTFQNYIYGKGGYENEDHLFGSDADSTYEKIVTAYENGEITIPDGFKVFVISTGNNNQDLLGYTIDYGYLKVNKTVDSSGVSDFSVSDYPLTGAEYTVYTNSSCTTVATDANGNNAVLTIDADGDSDPVKLITGTYYVKETKTPDCGMYDSDGEVYEVTVTTDHTESEPLVVTSSDKPTSGYGRLHKAISNSSAYGVDTGEYTVGGAVYTVYSDYECTDYVATLTVEDSGYSNTVQLAAGTYYVKETSSPSNLELDESVSKITIYPGKTTTLYVTDKVKTGKAKVQKVSSNSTLVSGNPNYSLEGAVYGIYDTADDAKSDSNRIVKLETGVNGDTPEVELACGSSGRTYYVKEITASKGYELDRSTDGYSPSYPGVYEITVTANTTTTVTSTETVKYDPLTISLTKIDKDTGELLSYDEASTPEGDADLSGAQFTVKFYAVDVSTYTSGSSLSESDLAKTWIIETQLEDDGAYRARLDSTHLVSGSDSLYTDDGSSVLPMGVITVTETKTPTGYLTDGMYYINEADSEKTTGTTWFGVIKESNGEVKLATGNEYYAADTVIQGGLSVQKIDYMLGSASNHADANLSGAEFTIVNASANSCVNSSGKEIASSGLSGTVTYEQVKAKVSSCTMEVITTGKNGDAATASDALPYGTYYVIETKASYGYWIDESFVGKAVIHDDGITVRLGESGKGTSKESEFLDINTPLPNAFATCFFLHIMCSISICAQLRG